MINGLKPFDFKGKKNLSPEEVLEQLKKNTLALPQPPLPSPSPSPPPDPAQPATTPENGDDFGIDEIVKNAEGDYEFLGLTVPGGIWDVITLAGQQFENGIKLNYNRWIQYSNGTAGFARAGKFVQFVQFPRTRVQEWHITPSRVRYWLMRASYEKRNSRKGKSVIKELRGLFDKDGHYPWQHNAELIEYCSGKNAVITTQGWPAGHPFGRIIDAPIAGDSPLEIRVGCNLDNTLYALVGDSDPERVKEVMEYHDQPLNKATKLGRCSTSINGKRVVVFGVYGVGSVGSVASIDADYSISRYGPARGVFADAKNFHRK